jgi:hypothetical protein
LKDMNEADGASLIGKISSRFTGDFMVLTPKWPLLLPQGKLGRSEHVTIGQFVSSIRWRNSSAHGAGVKAIGLADPASEDRFVSRPLVQHPHALPDGQPNARSACGGRGSSWLPGHSSRAGRRPALSRNAIGAGAPMASRRRRQWRNTTKDSLKSAPGFKSGSPSGALKKGMD